MKRSLLTIPLAFAFIFANAQTKIDVIHYKFEIFLSDSTDEISGRATIVFEATAPLEYLELDLTGAVNKKGMKITDLNTPRAFAIRHTASPTLMNYTHSNDRVRIELKRKLNKHERDSIAIEYKGVPKDGLIISKNKYGHRTFFADNWPNRGHNWLPCHDDPADKASVEFIVTAPQHYQVIANGIQVEETNFPENKKRTHWKEDVPVSTKVMVIGVADFAVNLAGTIDNCIPVYSWVYPEDRDKGFYDYAQAAEILPFFIKNVGPYAYKKLANVQSKTIFGGLENANTIFYSESSVSGNRKSESLLAHEIAHQWFGNMATEKSFAHLWLSEGFATYMTILYMENKYGPDTAIHMLKQDRSEVIAFAKTSNKSVVDSTKDYMELLNPNSYQKGGWILHMLRSQLGDSLFWKSIRTYYATYAGKTADTDDLRKVFESVSGKNLETFFRQWLYSPGIPVLDLRWSYAEGKITVEVMQRNQGFEFPFEILVQQKADEKPKIYSHVASGHTKFVIPVNAKPVRVEFDPGTKLLFEGNLKEQ